MKRTIITSIVLLLTSILMPSKAQYVLWGIKPAYDNMVQCADNLFIVTNANKVGVINGSGKVIVPIEADQITGFYQGYALAIQHKGGKNLVMGIVSADGQFTKMSTDCYAIPSVDFCSEGFLAVEFPDGKRGYMRTDGSIAHAFDKKITNLLPFSEGFAVVGSGTNSQLVDKNFTPVQITIGGGYIYGIFSVYRGVALVYDDDTHFYEFDTRTGRAKSIGGIKADRLQFDYLGAAQTGRPQTVVYDPIRTKDASSVIKTQKQNGKYGYEKSGNSFIPYQFDEADAFYGNHAIVKQNGKYGLLALHDGNGAFAATPANNGKINTKGKKLSHKFSLNKPSKLGGDIQVNVISNGNLIPAKAVGGEYEFTADATSSGKQNFDVEVSDNGLKLWQGSLSYQYGSKINQQTIERTDTTPEIIPPKHKKCNTCGMTIDKCPYQGHHPIQPEKIQALRLSVTVNNNTADKDNRCYVTISISNPNSSSVTTTVNIDGKGLEKVSRSISIPAGGSNSVKTYITVKKAGKYSVKAKETKTGQKASKDVQLRPRD